MSEVEETLLPGVGVRYEFVTEDGVRLGVISRFGGERELLVYDRSDPDRCAVSLELGSESAHTLIDLLGGSRVSQRLAEIERQVEGLRIEWLTVQESSEIAGKSLAEAEVHTRTQAYVIAVLRGDLTAAAPGGDFVLRAGDRIIALGTPEALGAVGELLE